jgi:hypothetical protein
MRDNQIQYGIQSAVLKDLSGEAIRGTAMFPYRGFEIILSPGSDAHIWSPEGKLLGLVPSSIAGIALATKMIDDSIDEEWG